MALLGMVAVFQENSLGKHVKFVFAWKTLKQFSTQTKRKHNKIIPSVCVQKRKPVSLSVFQGNKQKKFIFMPTVSQENKLYFLLSVFLKNKQKTFYHFSKQ